MTSKSIKCSLKRERDLNLQNKYENPEKKRQTVKRRYDYKEEFTKLYKKKTMWKIEHQVLHKKTQSIRKILKCDC